VHALLDTIVLPEPVILMTFVNLDSNVLKVLPFPNNVNLDTTKMLLANPHASYVLPDITVTLTISVMVQTSLNVLIAHLDITA